MKNRGPGLAQLAKDRHSLLALNSKKKAPKLGLLLNCFGANAETIKTLGKLESAEFILLTSDQVTPLLAALPGEEQSIVLCAQKRLLHGELPFRARLRSLRFADFRRKERERAPAVCPRGDRSLPYEAFWAEFSATQHHNKASLSLATGFPEARLA